MLRKTSTQPGRTLFAKLIADYKKRAPPTMGETLLIGTLKERTWELSFWLSPPKIPD
jgi:hypothetical protein